MNQSRIAHWTDSEEEDQVNSRVYADLCICFLLRWINIRLNKQRENLVLEAEKVRRGWSEADVQRERERHAFADLTDKQNIFFVYTA